MTPMELSELLGDAISKIEFYWNFYMVLVIALVGWLVGSRTPFSRQSRCLLSLAFGLFAIGNLFGGLWGSWAFAEALRLDLLGVVEGQAQLENFERALEAKDFGVQRWFGLALHIVLDFVVLFLIWTLPANPRGASS